MHRQNSCIQHAGGLGVPQSGKNLVNHPIRHLSPFLDQGLSPPAKVCPWKFEKFKYIFVSNLTTFKLKSTLKSCISCLKKWPNFPLGGQFRLQSDFFCKSPLHPTPFLSVIDRDQKFWVPPSKFREKNPYLHN